MILSIYKYYFDCEVTVMNLGFDNGALGDPAPEMNRTLADFFTAIIQIFSFISAAIKGLFGVK